MLSLPLYKKQQKSNSTAVRPGQRNAECARFGRAPKHIDDFMWVDAMWLLLVSTQSCSYMCWIIARCTLYKFVRSFTTCAETDLYRPQHQKRAQSLSSSRGKDACHGCLEKGYQGVTVGGPVPTPM